jgi:carbamoylphosphate synthase small subunit
MLGNYGVPGMEMDEFGLPKYFESNQIQVAGVIVADYSWEYSHWAAEKSLSQWLKVCFVFMIVLVFPHLSQDIAEICYLLYLLQEW